MASGQSLELMVNSRWQPQAMRLGCEPHPHPGKREAKIVRMSSGPPPHVTRGGHG
jgi:hypothetical protein